MTKLIDRSEYKRLITLDYKLTHGQTHPDGTTFDDLLGSVPARTRPHVTGVGYDSFARTWYTTADSFWDSEDTIWHRVARNLDYDGLYGMDEG